MAECTIYDKLRYIAETKDLIKTAIETQDVEVLESDTFRKYAEYITEIRKVASVNGETGDIILKTINGQNLVGEGDIVIQGGGGGSVTAGVNKIIMGDEDYGWNTYTGDVKLTNGWIDLDDDGISETYDIRVGTNAGSSLWFGFNSTDNSIKIEDNGSRLSFTVNPDILGGNVDLSDYYTKGEVYNKNEVNELIDGVTAGDVDLTNYYTKQEVDNKIPSLNGYATEQWVEDKNYLTEHQSLEDYAKKSDIPDVCKFITSVPAEYITEEELNGKGYLTSIPDTYVTDWELSTAISDKVSQTALNEAIEGVENKIPSLDGYATEQWVEDKNYLTEHQSLEDYAKKSDIPTIPTSNTAFTNDAGFITLNEVPETDLSNYYTKTETYSKDEVDGLLENTGGGGGSSLNVIELTQAEYDALSEKQTNTIYVITDAVELKFKTINGQEITGEGDIEIQVNTEQFYTKSEIDALIGGVSDKITELNELI